MRPTVSQRNLADYANERIEAARKFPKSGLLRRDLRLPLLDMTVWFTSEQLAGLCDSMLVQSHDGRFFEQVAEIFVMDSQSVEWELPVFWDEDAGFSSRDFDRVLASSNKRGFYHHDAPSWQFYDPASATGVHSLPRPLDLPPWEHGTPLRLFIHWAHAAAGRRLTHAATLGLGGYGALIIGASGSGKSGTTLAGLLNGLESVGDDYIVVEQGARVVAHSVFKVFKQDEDGLLRAGIEADDLPDARLNWHGKIEFDAARLAPGAFTNQMEIGALLLPRIARANRTTIEPVAGHDAALALAPSAVFQLPGDAAEGFQFFASLVRRLPAFSVTLSENPAEIADTIGSFLAREARHSS